MIDYNILGGEQNVDIAQLNIEQLNSVGAQLTRVLKK